MAADQPKDGFIKETSDGLKAAYQNFMRGGEIQAAARQGFNEIGAALKAFPDSIQIDEPGAVFNPLYRDMPSETKADLPSPSDIADGITAAPTKTSTLQAGQQDTAARGEASSVHGQGGGIQGPEHGVYGPEHGVYGRNNGALGLQAADQDKPESLPSPGEIGDGKVAQEGGMYWRQKIKEERMGNQGGNAGNDQNEQYRERSLPEEQQEQGRGRGR
jgi:hypothetical protein